MFATARLHGKWLSAPNHRAKMAMPPKKFRPCFSTVLKILLGRHGKSWSNHGKSWYNTRYKPAVSGVERQNAIHFFVSRFWCFLAQWETFWDRVLAFDLFEESCYLGRIATAKCSQIPYWSAPSLAISCAGFAGITCDVWPK